MCGSSVQRFLSPPFPTLCYPLCISVMGACLIKGVGAHGWVVRFCQPSVQSPPWSWLPKMVAPGCLGHPTSTDSVSATKLFTCFIENSSILQSYMCGGKKALKNQYMVCKTLDNQNSRTFQAQKKIINKKMETPFHTLSLPMFLLLLFTFNFWNCVIKFSKAQSLHLS